MFPMRLKDLFAFLATFMKKFESLKLLLADFQPSCCEKAARDNKKTRQRLFSPIFFCVCVILTPVLGRARCSAAVASVVRGTGVISMTTVRRGFLVAKVVQQGQGVSDCSHPDRKSKRTTMMGEGGEVQFSEAKLLLGWRGKISQ